MNQTDPTAARGAKAEALLLHFTAEAHRRKWHYDRGLNDDGVPIKSEAFDALHRLGEEMRTALEELRRVPAAVSAVVSPPTDRAARALDEVRRMCETTIRASVRVQAIDQARDTLAIIGRIMADQADDEGLAGPCDCGEGAVHYTTADCPAELRRLAAEAQQPEECSPACSEQHTYSPGCALAGAQQQPDTEAHPPLHAWRVATRDPLANEWAPGSHFASRPHAVERYETANSTAPLWQDGTPVERRIVRETTTYTVEEPAAGQQAAAEVPTLAQLADADPDYRELLMQRHREMTPEQQPAAADGEETPRSDRIVAYGNPELSSVLLCREHGDGWRGLIPLTSEDLPDGGLCTWGEPEDPCGRDVLIDPPRP